MTALPLPGLGARRAARRAHRLATLESILRDCEALIAHLEPKGAQADDLRRRIAGARSEIDRLRGIQTPIVAAPATQSRIMHELAHWTGNLPGDEGQSSNGGM